MAPIPPSCEERAALASPRSALHDEWLMDESIEMSFPASDPASATQPGSLVAERYAAFDRFPGNVDTR